MCGRFALDAPPKVIKSQFHLSHLPEIKPNYNACPTEPILIVIQTGDELRGELFRWGLIPFFSKSMPKSRTLINARAETVESSPSFKMPFRKKRGLVLINGFYEWTTENGAKQPYYITHQEHKVLAVASLWDSWVTPEKEVIYSCCMITTQPTEIVKPFHDRMPAIIDENQQKIWLDMECDDEIFLKKMLEPEEIPGLFLYSVTPKVGSPYYKNQDAISPL